MNAATCRKLIGLIEEITGTWNGLVYFKDNPEMLAAYLAEMPTYMQGLQAFYDGLADWYGRGGSADTDYTTWAIDPKWIDPEDMPDA